jgi:hypothetical protein
MGKGSCELAWDGIEFGMAVISAEFIVPSLPNCEVFSTPLEEDGQRQARCVANLGLRFAKSPTLPHRTHLGWPDAKIQRSTILRSTVYETGF